MINFLTSSIFLIFLVETFSLSFVYDILVNVNKSCFYVSYARSTKPPVSLLQPQLAIKAQNIEKNCACAKTAGVLFRNCL